MKLQLSVLLVVSGRAAAGPAETTTTTRACVVQNPALLGNALCNTDGEYNTKACGWDGGDCCLDTCVSTDTYTCGFNAAGTNYFGNQYCDDETACLVSDLTQIGNGYCNNGDYNTAACEYDGGDCCEETCVDSETYSCGDDIQGNYRGFPTCQDANACPVPSSQVYKLGNAHCDTDGSYNTARCGWDGGDCCVSSCVDTEDTTCETFMSPAICLDPSYQPVPQPPTVLENCTSSNLAVYANTQCNEDLNNYDCNWDGGDCCPTTCDNENSPSSYVQCSVNSDFNCKDPSLSLAAKGLTGCFVDTPSYVGDGYCDGEISDGYNIAACDYDGGDCCSDTCSGNDAFDCGEKALYNCQDSDSENYGDCPVGGVNYRSSPGNGICEETGSTYAVRLNNAACSWDGGDCCPSTCPMANCTNYAYTCLDPNAGEVGTSGACIIDFTSYLGDGACDTDGNYNTAACGWDGGDCCPSTCTTFPNVKDSYECGLRPFHCIDPAAYENANYTGSCQATPISSVGDGYCDAGEDFFNTARCGYDGGDCCASTCDATNSPWTCGYGMVDGEYVYVGYGSCTDPINMPNTTTATAVPSLFSETTIDPLSNGNAVPTVQAGANVGGIVGGVIGALLVIAIVVTVVYIFVIKKNTRYVSQVDEPGARNSVATTTGDVQLQGKEPNSI